jgi:DNA-binding NarL/FixJ family response regulator
MAIQPYRNISQTQGIAMDKVVSDAARENEQWKPMSSALRTGIIIVDADGQIVWIDDNTRRRMNGGLSKLALPFHKSGVTAIDCFLTAVDVMINGEQAAVCVIQETKESGRDLITAIESVLADTSSFTRTIIGKLRGLRQVAEPSELSSDIDLLTVREREVLGLICKGKTDAEMSVDLKLSQNTVRNHVASLYRKIGVNRRAAAIIWARERAITSDVALDNIRRQRLSPQTLY